MRTNIFDKVSWEWGLLAVLLLAASGARAGQQIPNGPPILNGQPNANSQSSSNSQPNSSKDQTPKEARKFADENRANEENYSDVGQTEAQIRLRQVYLTQEVQMVKDSHKLVALAAKLNAEVASQHGSALTLAELKEVAQIEKLARSVRTKMEAPVPGNLFQTGPTNTNIYSPN